MYRCEAKSVEAFVQQIAVSYVLHGYYFFAVGNIPEGKDLRAVDANITARYDLAISKWTRCRRKREGVAGVQYLRHGRFFVIAATEGEHKFLDNEKTTICDLRREPIQCFGYGIRCYQRRTGKWHPSVRIGDKEFAKLKQRLRKAALRLSAIALGEKIRRLPFAPFAPVRSQFLTLLRLVNRRRKRAGLPLVSGDCVRRKRKPVRVFNAV